MFTKDVLAHTKALSIKLQGQYIVKAYKKVEFVKWTLKCARYGVDGYNSRVYGKALQVAAKVQVDESLPKTTGRRVHRVNVPVAT